MEGIVLRKAGIEVLQPFKSCAYFCHKEKINICIIDITHIFKKRLTDVDSLVNLGSDTSDQVYYQRE